MKKILILAAILAVPGFLYYLLTVGGQNRYKPLPFFGPKKLSGTFHKYHGKKISDTTFHQVPEFKLTDQNGQEVSSKTLAGKVTVVNFFYANCPDVCNKMNSNMDTLAKYLHKNKMIELLSITVDPTRDTPQALKNYSRRFPHFGTKWKFLTGDTSGIYSLARNGFLVDALQHNSEFVYSNKLILLDAERRIRGYYLGTDKKELSRLGDELKVQIAEELRKIKAPN